MVDMVVDDVVVVDDVDDVVDDDDDILYSIYIIYIKLIPVYA
jgi:hypothetical protein